MDDILRSFFIKIFSLVNNIPQYRAYQTLMQIFIAKKTLLHLTKQIKNSQKSQNYTNKG